MAAEPLYSFTQWTLIKRLLHARHRLMTLVSKADNTSVHVGFHSCGRILTYSKLKISHNFKCHDGRRNWYNKCSWGNGGGNASLDWVRKWCLSWELNNEKEWASGRSEGRVMSGELSAKLSPGTRLVCLSHRKKVRVSVAEWVHSGWSEMNWGSGEEWWCGPLQFMVRKSDTFKVCWEAGEWHVYFTFTKIVGNLYGSRESSCHGVNKEFLERRNTKLCSVLLRG